MRIVLIWFACQFLAAAIIPPMWGGLTTGYSGDSFWTLSDTGRIGVVAITVTGLLILAGVSAWKTKIILRWSQHRWRIPVWLFDAALGVALFAVLFSISPQVYYSFYQQVIAGLPDQWVIDGPINWDRLRDIAIPKTGGALADHAALAVMGGGVLFTAYLHRR